MYYANTRPPLFLARPVALPLPPSPPPPTLYVKKTMTVWVPIASDIVTPNLLEIGLRVCRNDDHWRPKKWRDDKRGPGTVIGFTDSGGVLVGENSGSKYDTDRVTHTIGPNWAVVRWDVTGKASAYPAGAEGPLGNWWLGGPCYSLRLYDTAR